MPILSPRHERFAQALASGKPADAAYAEAGYKPDRGHAARLASNGNIRSRVAELQAAGARQAEFTVERVVMELHQTYLDAKRANQHGPAVRALELIGRTLGAFVDKVSVADHSSISDDEIVSKLAGDDPLLQERVRKMLGRDRFSTH